jgi:ribosome-associated protein
MTANKRSRPARGIPARASTRAPTRPRPSAATTAANVVLKRTLRLTELVTAALDDLKAQNVAVLDVRTLTGVADTIVVASGTSDRHVKSLAARVEERAKQAGFRALGVEGERGGEWVLVDLQDVIVHVMLPRVREFYGLEKLWDARAGERAIPA